MALQQNLITVSIAIVVMMAYGYAQDLHVTVVPTRSKFAESQVVEVTLKYENKGSTSILLYKWWLPDQQLYDPLFEVTRDGKPVAYVGPVAKRRPPTAKDMVTLGPGKSVKASVHLSTAYNMTETGNYAVQFKMDSGPMLQNSASLLKTANTPSSDMTESILTSSSVGLYAVGRSNALIEKSTKVNVNTKAITYSYTGCSATRVPLIVAAVKSAASLTSNCNQYLARVGPSVSSRYTTWFGAYSSSNLATLKVHFNNLYYVFNTISISFDCTCQMENTFAFVYPTIPYKIHLCDAFWTAPAVGTDSQAGTLVHETSHFNVIAGTKDITYGQTNCKSLAKSSPAKAITNADSHEYFAENHPVLS